MASNIPEVPDYIDEQDYEYILARYLGNVRNDVDKREGSIIWDSGAPLCIELAIAYMYIQSMILNCFAASAPSPYLEMRCEEQGITREPATYAKRLGVFTNGQGSPYAVAIGTEFSTVDETNLVNFTVTEVYTVDGETVPGSYILTCNEVGEIGNQYFGEIVPVYNLQGLATATLSDVLIPGEAEQDIEDLRQKYFDTVNQKAFGGNITEYREFVTSLDGVGTCQVYPVWNGGGTVKISFINSDYNRPSQVLINEVQKAVDPHYNDEYAGKGLGTAPIGHVVTVVGPEDYTVDIDAEIEVENGRTLQQVIPGIETNLQSHFLSLRKKWAEATDLNEYSLEIIYERIKSTILNSAGVKNILSCTINELEEDIVLQEDKIKQQLPIIGEINIDG